MKREKPGKACVHAEYIKPCFKHKRRQHTLEYHCLCSCMRLRCKQARRLCGFMGSGLLRFFPKYSRANIAAFHQADNIS